MSFSFTCFIFRSVFSKLRERCISSACCLTKHSLREDRFCLFYKVSFWLNSSSSSGGASVVPEVQIKKKKKRQNGQFLEGFSLSLMKHAFPVSPSHSPASTPNSCVLSPIPLPGGCTPWWPPWGSATWELNHCLKKGTQTQGGWFWGGKKDRETVKEIATARVFVCASKQIGSSVHPRPMAQNGSGPTAQPR